MELSQIQQYSHKITKIKISNTNEQSSYSYVTIKIHLEKETNEIIRFSLTESPTSTEWLTHQSSDNDYFLRIPNITPSITEIYAHFFPAELYDYTEDEQIFSIYDFSDFNKETTTNQWDGAEYPLQIEAYGYEMVNGYDNKPLIRSLLKESVTKYKDPNYKNYTTSTEYSDDMTEKGRFPLSSRYRCSLQEEGNKSYRCNGSLYRTAPNINNNEHYNLPYWQPEDMAYSDGASKVPVSNGIEEGFIYDDNTSVNEYDSNNECIKRGKKIPYWEAKIHKSGLSPLITDTPETEDEDNPINVYLNYQYLPTSTEYHQHYFGFEGNNIEGNKQVTSNKTYEAFDSEELGYVNQVFNESDEEKIEKVDTLLPENTMDNNSKINYYNQNLNPTYRLIRHGNPFDNRNILYINHKNIYNINLDDIAANEYCVWKKTSCSNENDYSKDYWTYVPKGEGFACFDVTLKANTYYVFKYFMFIPADAYVEDDSCYIEIQSTINDDTEVIGQLSNTFKNQDKKLRHQWIYHEIPFYTYESTNRIYIKGPQHSNENIVYIRNNHIVNDDTAEKHDCKNDVIHFYSMQIAEMVEYSPVLKYTRHGLYIVEGSEYTKKSLNESTNTECTANIAATNQWINNKATQLPIPLTDIYIFFDDDFDIIYDKLTSELYYTKSDEYPFTFDNFNENFDTTLSWVSDDNLIDLQYDRITKGDNAQTDQESTKRDALKGELRLFSTQHKVFTTGINNELTLRLQDAYGNPITTGEIECSIWTSDGENDTPYINSMKYLGTKTPDINGIVEYKGLNFKNFSASRETYYLRVKYINRCYEKDVIKWKELSFVEEHRDMYIYTEQNVETLASSIYDDSQHQYIKTTTPYSVSSNNELPLQLNVKIMSRNNIIDEGYCELSIDDRVIQTTFVDRAGIADFYLDENDLKSNSQVVKIEYFTKPNESVNFVDFTINYNHNGD